MKSLFCFLLLPHLALAAAPSPYAGGQNRAIKALSEAEISTLLSGHGMGLARAAELNSYPGPRHVLDLGDELKLTAAQVTALNRVFDAMKAAAIPLGRELITRETELDRLFTGKQATTDAVRALTREIGRLQGELRAVHLNAHVATAGLLHAAQISRYDSLRGYADAAPVTPAPQP
ncbi:MAG: hypothetical protein JWQ83_1789 [Lacunisphaera sp.]|nr:hypothetical protein [Lacunisphaera sp.]